MFELLKLDICFLVWVNIDHTLEDIPLLVQVSPTEDEVRCVGDDDEGQEGEDGTEGTEREQLSVFVVVKRVVNESRETQGRLAAA